MAYRKASIVNCRRASIRRTPWIPLHAEDIAGIRDGPIDKEGSVSKGDTVEIDDEDVVYDWTGRKFYKIKHPSGWIYEGCVNVLGGGGDD